MSDTTPVYLAEQAEHVRGSTLLVAGRLVALLFTVATQVVLVRSLTRSEYGAFAFALALTSSSALLLSLGQGRSLSRFLAIYEERGEYGRLFGSLVIAIGTIAVTTAVLVLTVGVWGDAILGGVSEQPHADTVLRILIVLAPLEALDDVIVTIFAVFSRPRSIFFRKYLLTPGLRFTVVVLLVLLGQGVVFLAVGYVATGLIGMAVYAFLLARVLRERNLVQHLRFRRISLPFRAVWTFSGAMLTTELVFLSMNTGSVMLLAAFHGAEDVAGYRAVFPSARMNQFVYTGFLLLFLPLVSRLFARGDRTAMKDVYWQNAAVLAVLSFPVMAMTVPFAEATTVTLFGQRYADAAVVLAVLSVGYYANAALGFNAATLQVLGRLRYVVIVNVSAALLNLALGLLLIPVIGVLGVAVSNGVTLVVQNLLNQWGLRRSLSMSLIDRRYAAPYAMIVVAAGALTAVQVIFHPGFVVCVVLAVCTSAALLLAARRWLRLAALFPELQRIPVLRHFVA